MTPKQRRQQDIFKRKTKEISDRAKDFKGNISERERESLGEQMPSMIGMGPEDIKGSMSEAERRMMQDNMPEMKKGGKVKMHKMPGGKMMKNSDMKKKKKMGGGMMSDESFQYSKGGTVRGQGIAIRGTKFKGIF